MKLLAFPAKQKDRSNEKHTWVLTGKKDDFMVIPLELIPADHQSDNFRAAFDRDPVEVFRKDGTVLYVLDSFGNLKQDYEYPVESFPVEAVDSDGSHCWKETE